MALKLSTREAVLLGVMAAGLLALVVGSGRENSSAATVGGQRYPGGWPFGAPPYVDVSLLESSPAGYDPSGRDLFKFREKQRPPLLPPPQTIIEQPIKRKIPVPVRPQQVEPAPAQPPKPGFAFIGVLGPKGNRIAVFEKGKEILVAQAGDLVDTGFELLEFGYEEVVLEHVGGRFNGRRTTLEAAVQ